MVHSVWSKKCRFGSTNSPVTLYTSLSTVLFVLKRKFKESKDLNCETWTSELGTGAGWEVRCLAKASSSLKTPAIPLFYKIITDNQSTKLVYNLVYRKGKVRVSSARVTGAVCQSDLDIGQGVGADNGARLLRAGPWLWDWQLVSAQSLKEGLLLDVSLIAF